MPKRSYTTKARYVPRRRTSAATVRKPYSGHRYGNDAFVKIEAIEPLSTTALSVQVFSTMRVVDGGAGTPGNTYLGNQAEFQAFQVLYARYEVVGMKAEVTLGARNVFSAANIAGGFAPRMPAVALYPTEDNNNTYPMQADCNTQGEVTSLYYAYSKDLKNSGNKFAFATSEAVSLADQGIVQFRGLLGAAVAAGTTVGNIKFTWYVRFHGRTRPGGIGIAK